MSEFEPLLEAIRESYKVIESFEVYYGLKQAGFKATPQSSELVRWCIAIQSRGYVITVELLKALSGKSDASLLHMLHRLGDNNVLTLIQDRKRRLRYIIHPRVSQILDPKVFAQRPLTGFKPFTPVKPVTPVPTIRRV